MTNQTNSFINIVWSRELDLQSLNLFFPTKAQTISNTTFPKDLNLNLEMMLNQIRVKQENSKKYTRNENLAARYSNAEVYKNYERLCHEDSCCHIVFSEMNDQVSMHSWLNGQQTYNCENSHDKIYIHT